MKKAIKLTTGILAMALMGTVGAAFAQNPDAIDNARSIAKSLQQKQANDTNAALDAAGVPAAAKPAAAKPAPGAPAPAVKPAAIPGSKSDSAAPASAPKTAAASGQHNQLQKVNVLQSADSVQIEISSSHAVTPRVSKMSSPARVVVELPETVVASSENKIPVGGGVVKGVRIGMDGKTPPTTSVVVDLEKACAYEVTPGAGGKLILTLHTQAGVQTVAKNNPAPVAKTSPAAVAKSSPAPVPAPAKSATLSAKPTVQPKTMVAKTAPPAAKPQPSTATAAVTKSVAKSVTKLAAKSAAKPAVVVAKADPMKPKQPAANETKSEAKTETGAASLPTVDAGKVADAAKPKPEDKKWAMNGKRDPFFSPVVQQGGSGCSTGKKCLEIGNINLRGVVKSDSGFIAVVTNNMNKAYFLRENDPVFNGYVVRITGDSVVFQETVQDKLGKPFTREVVKRIFTPAV